VQHRVAVRERAALCVLAGQTDRNPFDEQRRECERFRLAPVDPAAVERLETPLELPLQLRMDRKVLRNAEKRLIEVAQEVRRNRSHDVVAGRIRDLSVGRRRRPERCFERVMRLSELGGHGPEELVGLLLRHYALDGQASRELLADGGMGGDLLGHQRLRVRGLVLLVVSVPAVPDEIDDDVAVEPPTEGERQADRGDRPLGVVGVHVDDRHVEALRQVARVACRATLARIGGEPDLVVRDQVERAARRVAVQLGEVQRLGYASLTRERRVAVDQDRERDARVVHPVAGGPIRLLRAGAALDDRVDCLEVARIGGERDGDLTGGRRARPFGAQVVLDVTRSAFLRRDDRLDRPLPLELPQDRVIAEPERMGENAQAAAMSHADHDLVGAVLGGELDRLVEHRHHHVQPFDRELFLPEEGASQVLLEPFDP
jgi:hypothetical protein